MHKHAIFWFFFFVFLCFFFAHPIKLYYHLNITSDQQSSKNYIWWALFVLVSTGFNQTNRHTTETFNSNQQYTGNFWCTASFKSEFVICRCRVSSSTKKQKKNGIFNNTRVNIYILQFVHYICGLFINWLAW